MNEAFEGWMTDAGTMPGVGTRPRGRNRGHPVIFVLKLLRLCELTTPVDGVNSVSRGTAAP